MSILDEIRNRATQQTVPARKDALLNREQSNEEQVSPTSEIDASVSAASVNEVGAIVSATNQDQSNPSSELKRLEEQLANFPEIAPRVPVRLEVEIKEELEALCSREKITIETLLEAFYITCKDKDTVMRQVLKESKKRLASRKAAGNIRSSITRLTNLTKK